MLEVTEGNAKYQVLIHMRIGQRNLKNKEGKEGGYREYIFNLF